MKIILNILYLIIIYGFIAPYLISYPDTLLVIVGFISLFSTYWSFEYVAKETIRYFSSKF